MLAIAMIIDAIFGEPESLWKRVPHPAIMMGKTIDWVEGWLNKPEGGRPAGVIALAVVCLLWVGGAIFIACLPFGWLWSVLGGAILLAHKSLVDHVEAVARGLRASVDEGRHEVSMIVGRDVSQLDGEGVSRAAIESAAENFSDGFVAPAFWFLIGGLPGIVLYKIVNTADSMIGHRTPQYEDFGWAAAKLDDLMNWIPARLTGLLFCLVGGGREAFDLMVAEAGQHRSPNAGWPEAAMAASINVSLSGPRIYEGRKTDDPYVNAEAPGPDIASIGKAVKMLWRSWFLLLAFALLVTLLF